MSDIDFTQIITDPYGEKVMADSDKPLTLGRAAYMGLTRILPGEERKDEREFQWFMLAMKIVEAEKAGTPMALAAKEITWINERVGKLFTDLVVTGRVKLMLEPGADTNG